MPRRRRRRERPGHSETLTDIKRLGADGGDWPEWRKSVADAITDLYELDEDVEDAWRTIDSELTPRVERLERESAKKSAIDGLNARIKVLEDERKERANFGKRSLHWLLQVGTALLLLLAGRALSAYLHR
jgi:hypothetical protein